MSQHGWRSKKAAYYEECYKRYLNAREKDKSLQQRIDSLTALLNPEVAATAKVQSILEGAKEDMKAQARLARCLLGYVPHAMRKSPKSVVLASQVFGVHELLENILYHLRNESLLHAQRVNRKFFDAIQGSLKFQRKLGLVADCDAQLTFPAQGVFKGVHFDTDTRWRPDMSIKAKDKILVLLKEVTDRDPVLTLGSRCRKMLICQPSLKSLDVSLNCCTRNRYAGRRSDAAYETLTSETGFTIGDIMDITKRMRHQHRLCTSAGKYQHDIEGFVEVSVGFEAMMGVKEDDPLLKEIQAVAEKQRSDLNRSRALNARLGPYITAKHAGKFLLCIIILPQDTKACYSIHDWESDSNTCGV